MIFLKTVKTVNIHESSSLKVCTVVYRNSKSHFARNLLANRRTLLYTHPIPYILLLLYIVSTQPIQWLLLQATRERHPLKQLIH